MGAARHLNSSFFQSGRLQHDFRSLNNIQMRIRQHKAQFVALFSLIKHVEVNSALMVDHVLLSHRAHVSEVFANMSETALRSIDTRQNSIASLQYV